MNIGGIEGKLKLVVGDEEIGLGTVYVPLKVTKGLTGGDFYHYKHGGFFACEGLLSLTRSITSLGDEQGDDE